MFSAQNILSIASSYPAHRIIYLLPFLEIPYTNPLSTLHAAYAIPAYLDPDLLRTIISQGRINVGTVGNPAAASTAVPYSVNIGPVATFVNV